MNCQSEIILNCTWRMIAFMGCMMGNQSMNSHKCWFCGNGFFLGSEATCSACWSLICGRGRLGVFGIARPVLKSRGGGLRG